MKASRWEVHLICSQHISFWASHISNAQKPNGYIVGHQSLGEALAGVPRRSQPSQQKGMLLIYRDCLLSVPTISHPSSPNQMVPEGSGTVSSTPLEKLEKDTSDRALDRGGRDHWPRRSHLLPHFAPGCISWPPHLLLSIRGLSSLAPLGFANATVSIVDLHQWHFPATIKKRIRRRVLIPGEG